MGNDRMLFIHLLLNIGGRQKRQIWKRRGKNKSLFLRKMVVLLPGPSVQILSHQRTLSYSNKEGWQNQRNTDPSPHCVAWAPTKTLQPTFLSPILEGCKQLFTIAKCLKHQAVEESVVPSASHFSCSCTPYKYYSGFWAQLSQHLALPDCKLVFTSQIRQDNHNKIKKTSCHQIPQHVGIPAFLSTKNQDLEISPLILLTPAMTDLSIAVTCFYRWSLVCANRHTPDSQSSYKALQTYSSSIRSLRGSGKQLQSLEMQPTFCLM